MGDLPDLHLSGREVLVVGLVFMVLLVATNVASFFEGQRRR